MPIVTAEADGVAEVTVDVSRCNRCGLCVEVCHGAPLSMTTRGVAVDQTRLFGCIGCGHCMAVCPRAAIRIVGRALASDDAFRLSAWNMRAGFDALLALMQARRSCRRFTSDLVPKRDVERILAAARTAPMSVPPSGVGVLVHHGRETVQALRRDLLDVIRRRRWLFRAPTVWALRLLLNREQWRLVRSFVDPIFEAYLGLREDIPHDVDWFFYDAPLAFSFYGSATADPADATIAATHAMLAAEALGYGTCFLGFPGYLLMMDGKLRARYELPHKARPGLTLIVGRPRVRPTHGITRRFTRIDWRPPPSAAPTAADGNGHARELTLSPR